MPEINLFPGQLDLAKSAISGRKNKSQQSPDKFYERHKLILF